MSMNCPTTHHPPRWVKRLLMSASKYLDDRTATGMVIAFDNVALDLAGNHEFQSGEFFAKAGQIHEQVRELWAAGGERQLRRSIGFKNEQAAGPKPSHCLSVNSTPNRSWKMGKNRNDSRPSGWLDLEV